jgi:predicted N-acetyltransferase YhbS
MFTIRVAAEQDADRVATIINAAFEVERPVRVQSDRTSPENVRELLAAGNTFFVAEQENRIVGAVFVRITGKTGYFGMLAVDPHLQRNGIGRALREHAEEFCKQQGCTEMTLTTGDFRTELLPYYTHAGYKVVSIEPGPTGVVSLQEVPDHPYGKAA